MTTCPYLHDVMTQGFMECNNSAGKMFRLYCYLIYGSDHNADNDHLMSVPQVVDESQYMPMYSLTKNTVYIIPICTALL